MTCQLHFISTAKQIRRSWVCLLANWGDTPSRGWNQATGSQLGQHGKGKDALLFLGEARVFSISCVLWPAVFFRLPVQTPTLRPAPGTLPGALGPLALWCCRIFRGSRVQMAILDSSISVHHPVFDPVSCLINPCVQGSHWSIFDFVSCFSCLYSVLSDRISVCSSGCLELTM